MKRTKPLFDDYEIAKRLQEDEYKNGAHHTVQPKKIKNKENAPVSLIDPEWEVIDPNPNIHSLFQAFDRKFFWNSLGSVEVKWSPRMYSCAGICTYKGRGGCIVSLSLPLLKLRPRKDLIETLLHEMIHAYLFLTKNDRDRDGHGPLFHEHMYRINAEAGTRITVYHDFHDEVRHYKTHWWRCDGPCRFKKPYFGIVKRAMNRAPGPSDFWFGQHQSTCGGTFVKIQEPEGFKSRKKKDPKLTYSPPKKSPVVGLPDIRNFFNNPSSPQKPSNNLPSRGKQIPKKNLDFINKPSSSSNPTPSTPKIFHGFGKTLSQPNSKVSKVSGTKNVHGFGGAANGFFGGLKSNKGGTLIENPKTGGKADTAPPSSKVSEDKPQLLLPFSGPGYTLSSSGSAIVDRSKSKLLSLYPEAPSKKPKVEPSVLCPVCGSNVNSDQINEHLDSCVQMDFTEEPIDANKLPPSPEKSLFEGCPLCGKSVYKTKINEHTEDCMQADSLVDLTEDDTPTPSTSSFTSSSPSSPMKHLFASCPVCDKKVYKTKMDEHLDSCLRLDSIMDSSGCEIVEQDDNVEIVDAKEPRCPCCDRTFSMEAMNGHLDVCLQRLEFD